MRQNALTNTALNFDVIIVYSEEIALSPNDKSYTGRTPFSKTGHYFQYNTTYAYFLEYCEQQGLTAAFATTKDICGPGLFSAVWIFEKRWKRKKKRAHTNYIFDKFALLSPKYKKQYVLLTHDNKTLSFFHNQKIRTLFDDKLATFKKFPLYAIPTVKINVISERKIRTAKKRLQKQLLKHEHTTDFTKNLVLKDQFGGGGENVFQVNTHTNILSIGKDIPLIYFILQPLIVATGFSHSSESECTDLRVILYNGKIIQSYMRSAQKGNFRANASLGGNITYLSHKQIPADVKKMSKLIDKILSVPHALYALDFIKSDTGHLYFIEGNSTPGINWFDATDETYAKELIHIIVQRIKNSV